MVVVVVRKSDRPYFISAEDGMLGSYSFSAQRGNFGLAAELGLAADLCI